MLKKIRRQYKLQSFPDKKILNNPFHQFSSWLNEAIQAEITDATAMTLSTVSSEGKPSSRIVLLKDLKDNSFVFFTNYKSKKGNQLDKNPNAAMLFYWPDLERQVRIEGFVNSLFPEESDKYFYSRPEKSKISAIISPQSQIIPSYEYLVKEFNEILSKKKNKDLPLHRPDYWGGYALTPVLFEFWQGRENRLHDRIEYIKKEKDNWEIHRLAP
ncbi:MAG: pyridoxamine 5'-phosphate oxidase [bacterium]